MLQRCFPGLLPLALAAPRSAITDYNIACVQHLLMAWWSELTRAVWAYRLVALSGYRPLSAYHPAWSVCRLVSGYHPAWVYRPVMLAYRLAWVYRPVWTVLLSEASLWASKAPGYQLALLAAGLGLPSALVESSGWVKAAPFPVTG